MGNTTRRTKTDNKNHNTIQKTKKISNTTSTKKKQTAGALKVSIIIKSLNMIELLLFVYEGTLGIYLGI